MEEGIADGVEVDSGDGGIVGVFEVGAVEVSAVGCAVGLHIMRVMMVACGRING
jgi:hypothetical protein